LQGSLYVGELKHSGFGNKEESHGFVGVNVPKNANTPIRIDKPVERIDPVTSAFVAEKHFVGVIYD
jgi:hypothetical protein